MGCSQRSILSKVRSTNNQKMNLSRFADSWVLHWYGVKRVVDLILEGGAMRYDLAAVIRHIRQQASFEVLEGFRVEHLLQCGAISRQEARET